MTHRLCLVLGLLVASCTEAHIQTVCNPTAAPGDACRGDWTCPATSIAGSTGPQFAETRCEDGTVHERTWSDPPDPMPHPIASCDPEAPFGAPCEGAWECPATTLEGSTGTHYEQIRCMGGVVVRDSWIEPLWTGDAGVPTDEDAGERTPLGCRVTVDEIVGSSTEACSRPGLSVEDDQVRVAWSDGRAYRGVLATRSEGSWTLDTTSFATNVRRVDLAGGDALVERHGGTVELWELSGGARLAQTFEGVHTGAQSRALGAAGGELHTLTVHTHRRPDSFYEWTVHHASGAIDAMEVNELAVGSAVRAYDVSVDSAGNASTLYQNGGIGGPVLLARDGAPAEMIPLPTGVEPYPYDDVAPAVATYPDGSAYVLVRRALPAGPLGARYEQLIAVRSRLGAWELLSLAEDEEDPCADVAPTEGATCTVDRTTYGPEAAVVAGPLGPLVLLATHHVRGERTHSCLEPAPGCVMCGWRGELTESSGLAFASDLTLGVEPIEGSSLAHSPSLIATASGGDVHLAVSDHDEGACRVRYMRISCGE